MTFGHAVTNSMASFKLNIKNVSSFHLSLRRALSDNCRSILVGELMTMESALETAQHDVKISPVAKVR